jgi:hypothetical protein
MLIELANGTHDLNAMGTSEGICKICKYWPFDKRNQCVHNDLRAVVARIKAESP